MSNKEALKLWNFYVDRGRSGFIEGVFAATDESLEGLIGKSIYIDEPLGKHSEFSSILKRDMFTELTDDQDFIRKAIEYGISNYGHNPFDHVNEEGGF